MRKRHSDLQVKAIELFGELAMLAAQKKSAKLDEIADILNELQSAIEEQNEYIDKLIAKGKNLSALNEVLRGQITELEIIRKRDGI